MNEIKLICTDIDGTLLNDKKEINIEDKKMLQKAWREKNIPIILTSGRFKQGLIHLKEILEIPCGFSCFNGAYVEWKDQILTDNKIELDSLKRLIPIIRENNSFPIIFDLNDYYMEKNGNWYEIQKKFYKKPGIIMDLLTLISNWEKVGTKPYKLLAKDPDSKNLKKTETAIRNAQIPGIEIYYSSPNIIEIVSEGTSKGNTIDTMVEELNISTDNVMSFGDYNNDLDLIKRAKYGIAMANAIDEIKQVAFDTTDSNNNGGIAKAISKYIFKDNN